jgi:phytoene dehydrogenase-like protein
MEKVRVKKLLLLAKLEENRKSHRAKFLKAQEGYRAECIEQLDKALYNARNNLGICTTFRLLAPTDQTGDYDVAIEMLKWEVADEVELEYSAFREYVLDEWSWKDRWMASNTGYMSKIK